MREPLSERGPGWTLRPDRLTNEDFGRLVRETYRMEAPVMPPRGDRGED